MADELTVTRSEPLPTLTVAKSEPLPSESGFWESLGNQVNPVKIITGMRDVAAHPIDAAKAYLQQNAQLADETGKAIKNGDYSEGFRHGLSYLLNGIPGLGAAIDQAGNQAARGNVAGGLGSATGIGLTLAAPSVLGPSVAGAAAKVADNPIGTAVEVGKFAKNPIGYTAKAAGRTAGRAFREGFQEGAPAASPGAVQPPKPPASEQYYAEQAGGTAEPSEAYYSRQQAPAAAPETQPATSTRPQSVEELSGALNSEMVKETPPAKPTPAHKAEKDFAEQARTARAEATPKWADYLQSKGVTADMAGAISHREQWRALAQDAGLDVPTPKGASAIIKELQVREKHMAPSGPFNPAAIQKLINIQERQSAQ